MTPQIRSVFSAAQKDALEFPKRAFLVDLVGAVADVDVERLQREVIQQIQQREVYENRVSPERLHCAHEPAQREQGRCVNVQTARHHA